MRPPFAVLVAALALAGPAAAQNGPVAPPPGVTPDMTLVAPPAAVAEGMTRTGGTGAAEITARPAAEGASQESQAAAASGGTPAVQPQAQGEAAAAATGDVPASTVAEPATPAATMAATDTASTGWSGGTGGAFIGTNPAGAVGVSKSWQPPTARGLDLMMGAADPG